MLNAYSVGQTIAANDYISFNLVALRKGETAVLSGNSTVQLNKAGVYAVSFEITGTPAAAGAVTVEMLKDGVAQPQATATLPAALTTVSVALPITTLVQVQHDNGPCCCRAPVVLQFRNTGVGLNNAGVRLVITKVC